MYFRTEIRARAATDESSKVEADVNRMSLQLGDRENSREKAIARTEQLAKKVLGTFKCKMGERVRRYLEKGGSI